MQFDHMVKIDSKWINPDFRRDPKTAHYCAICQRDLKPNQPHRFIMFELDRYEAIAPDQWQLAQDTIPQTRAPHLQPVLFVQPIGMDCAKRLGLEWSKEK